MSSHIHVTSGKGLLLDKMYSFKMFDAGFINEICQELELFKDEIGEKFKKENDETAMDGFVSLYNLIKSIESEQSCKIDLNSLSDSVREKVAVVADKYAENAEMPHRKYYYESFARIFRGESG